MEPAEHTGSARVARHWAVPLFLLTLALVLGAADDLIAGRLPSSQLLPFSFLLAALAYWSMRVWCGTVGNRPARKLFGLDEFLSVRRHLVWISVLLSLPLGYIVVRNAALLIR